MAGWRKYAIQCAECKTIENLTRHHLKNNDGKKTGKIKILCRKCHNRAENTYQSIGITGSPALSKKEKLQLDYMNGLLPFYSLYGAIKK